MKESSKEVLKLKGVVRNLRNRLAASKKFAAKKVNECADLAYTVSDLKNSLKGKDEVIDNLGKELAEQYKELISKADEISELLFKFEGARSFLLRSQRENEERCKAEASLHKRIDELELMLKQREGMLRLSEAGNDFKEAMLDHLTRMKPVRRKRKNTKK